MIDKKSFLLGVLTGAVVVGVIGGTVCGVWYYNNYYMADADADYEISLDDLENGELAVTGEESDALAGDEAPEAQTVLSESGNPIIMDVSEKVKIEIPAPEGYKLDEEYASGYAAEFVSEKDETYISCSIDDYTAEEMKSYYDDIIEFIKADEDGTYKDINISETKTKEINGYTVNYMEFSYTIVGDATYVEYCAYVMLGDSKEYICSIYGKKDQISEDLIELGFKNVKLPVGEVPADAQTTKDEAGEGDTTEDNAAEDDTSEGEAAEDGTADDQTASEDDTANE